MAGFRNTEYKDSWEKKIPNTNREYADGTYFEAGDKYVVYDGAQNLMGYVNKNGTFTTDGGELTECKATFLRTAKAELVKQGLVATLSGNEL